MDTWNRFVSQLKIYPQLGLSIDLSLMNVSLDSTPTLDAQILKAFEEMTALERGEIANADEERMVGHYWLRAPELAPTKEISLAIRHSVDDIKSFTNKIHQGGITNQQGEKFQNVLLIGIGGSALGPQLVAQALGGYADKMNLYFFDNTDPDGFVRTLKALAPNLSKTLVIVISKSGSTKETQNGAKEVAAAMTQQGLSFSKQAIAVTCPSSTLEKQAIKESWLKVFSMWDWVGGRTSLFSAVGLLPAALQGVNIDRFLEGAKQMDEITRSPQLQENPAMLLSLMWFLVGEGKGKKDMVVLPYKDRLVLFSKYLQQLVMESLGKEKDRKGNVVHQGIAVYGNKGSTDQHAYVQQLRDGVPNFFATFIEVLEDVIEKTSPLPRECVEVDPGVTSGDYLHGFLQGTRKALAENGRPSITLTLDRLTEEGLGALIALYERAVGYYASLVNINAYNQPGVEAGKKAAQRVIEIQKKIQDLLKAKEGAFTCEEISNALGEREKETVYKILEHLAANAHTQIHRIGERGPTTTKYTYSK